MRAGQQAGARYLGIPGLLDLKRRLSADGRPYEILSAADPGNRTDVWWVLLFAGLALYWLARRELTLLSTIFVVTLVGALRGAGVTALAEPPDPDAQQRMPAEGVRS